MNIIQITPGTGSFYCGSCLRDHTIAAELRRRGHDVLIVPMYLPMVTEDDDDPDTPIFFGAVNAYLQQKSGIFRHTPRWIDNILDSSAVLGFAARQAGSTEAADLGDMTYSMLAGETGRQVKELEKLADWLKTLPKPDIICLSNCLLIGIARRIKEELQVPVVCTLQGEDSFLDSLPSDESQRCWELLAERAADIDQFIPVSQTYGDIMRRRMKLADAHVSVVSNGIDVDDLTPPDAPPPGAVIGYLARMCFGKGLPTLIDAFIELKKRNTVPGATLHVAGAKTDADQPLIDELEERLKAAGFRDDVTFSPNISRDEKRAFLQSLTVLSVPATYGESFGLYIVEAMACGVPVVQPRSGAFPELIEATGGGVLCEPDDPQSLADALQELLLDPEQRNALGKAARTAVKEKYSVAAMADSLLAVYDGILTR
jgi:glycosyltransferase involved in cell wall biosynthesis